MQKPVVEKVVENLCSSLCETARGCTTVVSMHMDLQLAGTNIPGVCEVSVQTELQRDSRSWAARSLWYLLFVLRTKMISPGGGVLLLRCSVIR